MRERRPSVHHPLHHQLQDSAAVDGSQITRQTHDTPHHRHLFLPCPFCLPRSDLRNACTHFPPRRPSPSCAGVGVGLVGCPPLPVPLPHHWPSSFPLLSLGWPHLLPLHGQNALHRSRLRSCTMVSTSPCCIGQCARPGRSPRI